MAMNRGRKYGENVLPTQTKKREGAGSREQGAGAGGGKTESNQATNKCNKYDDKGSKGSRRHKQGLSAGR